MAQLLAGGCSAVDAHEKAGYKRDDGNAARWAQKPEVAARTQEIIQEITGKVVESVVVDKAWVLSMLIKNAKRCAEPDPVTGAPINPSASNRALELLGREFNMFVERREVGLPGEFAALEDDALMDELRTQALELGVEVEEGATAH